MKKVLTSLLLVTLTLFSLMSCVQASTYVQNPNQIFTADILNTYASRFDFFWSSLNSHYIFWDVDHTDWDSVYDEYMPKFEELDKKVASASAEEKAKVLSGAYVSAYYYYKDLTSTLIDHHMSIRIFDPYREGVVYQIRTCEPEIESRDYFHPFVLYDETNTIDWIEQNELVPYFSEGGIGSGTEDGYKTATNLMSEDEIAVDYYPLGEDSGSEKNRVVSGCCIAYDITIDKKSSNNSDMHVMYLLISKYHASDWLLAYMSSPSICPSAPDAAFDWKAGKTLDTYFRTVRKYYDSGELAGLLLDNRGNMGGDNIDFDYFIGLYTDKPVNFSYTKIKEGFGKTDYSAEVPNIYNPNTKETAYYCDLVSADIPYVVLCDLHSVSCGETSTAGIAAMGNSYIIGERTYGATGPLMSGPKELVLTYGGTFGDEADGPIYAYTSAYSARLFTRNGYKNVEGFGVTPDKEIYFKPTGDNNTIADFRTMIKAQVKEAFSYISNY